MSDERIEDANELERYTPVCPRCGFDVADEITTLGERAEGRRVFVCRACSEIWHFGKLP